MLGVIMGKYLDLVIVGVLVVVGVFFQTFRTDAKTTNQGMYYENVRCSDNVELKSVSGMNLDYSASLEGVGDSFDLYFDVVNSNDVDMMLDNYVLQDSDAYITYELYYQDGSKIRPGDIIKSGESKKIHYIVSYVNLIEEDDYTFDTSFTINYEQAI